MTRRRSLIAVLAAAAAAFGFGFAVAAPASAEVGTAPAAWTPQITSTDSIVRKMVQCGDTMFAVGQFSQVTQNGTVYARTNAFSFSATTGALTSWDPAPDGTVNSIALSADCSTAYLGGEFSYLGTTKAKSIIAVDAVTGAVRSNFQHTTNGAVYTVALVNDGQQLLVGGAFTQINGSNQAYYASLNPADGTVTPYLHVAVAGLLSPDSRILVYNQQLSPSGTHMLFEGKFTTIDGQSRQQAAELDITPTGATLNPWYQAELFKPCSKSIVWYIRTAAWSPDEQTIYLGGTGGSNYKGYSQMCDAASAVTASMPSQIKWINQTGGDSIYAVAASTTDLYVGGHERWLNNNGGHNRCVPGCASRPGIGAIDTTSGLATSWNPTRDRGIGAQDLLITSAGLWVSSDTYYGSSKCGHKVHPGICFFPGTA